jgi:Xaa-Pro aminopeptidase
MKNDLDRLMEERRIGALLILPGENEDPYRAYLSNGARFSGMVVKKRGEPPVLIANGMERDEAAKSGFTVYTYDDFGYGELLREHRNDLDQVKPAWYRRIFETLGVQGRLTVYGVGDINGAFRLLTALSEGLGDRVEFVTEQERNTIFDRAYETKDAGELAKLREVARRTSAVMRATREWIASHRARDGVVIGDDDSPVTIGDAKRYVRSQLFEQDLEDPEGMIFAQGRDAGVPHSRGENGDPLRLGQTIIFDLFPREPGGYFHDVTRTWCIGHATQEVQAAYEAVREAHRRSIAMCEPGVTTNTVQHMVCQYFEKLGHPTLLSTPGTTDGYVHGLAHGLGLNVHEAPFFPTHSEQYCLQPGNVFTIEPGLYYPERGYGVRVEDTVYLNEAGQIETLTDCPYDLVIDLKD